MVGNLSRFSPSLSQICYRKELFIPQAAGSGILDGSRLLMISTLTIQDINNLVRATISHRVEHQDIFLVISTYFCDNEEGPCQAPNYWKYF